MARVERGFDFSGGYVRRLVDDNSQGGQFILTGSAPTAQTHSGAGRITTMRMRPLTLAERGVEVPSVSLAGLLDGSAQVVGRTDIGLRDYVDELLAGRFPGIRQLPGVARQRQLDGYVERIVDHDLAEAGLTVRRPATVMAWLRAYAAATGTTASWEKIRGAAASASNERPPKTTIMPYVDVIPLALLGP